MHGSQTNMLKVNNEVTAESEVSSHALHHHFADLEQQRASATLGMWVFLVTEILFFGGMFAAYLVYRTAYPAAFIAGSQSMEFWAGVANTVILLTSSLTMVLAVHAAQTGERRMFIIALLLTLLFGTAFLGIKAYEYHHHWVMHDVPGPNFQFEGPDPRHVELFFSLYFAMTGFHALHMVIGIGLVATILYFGWKGRYTPQYNTPVENVGLYWHFVDIIWIFLFPLLYLISKRHG